MAWINDELSHLSGPEEIEKIAALFQRATLDYLSVDIWSAYLDFFLEFDPEVCSKSSAGLKKGREVCEAALTAAGLHVTEGGKIWDAFLKWELSLLESSDGGDKQEERVRSLFCRQLQVPLSNGPSTLEVYTQWEAARGKTVPPHITKAYEKAQQAVALRKPYEQALEQASLTPQDGSHGPESSAKLLASHMAYLKLELAAEDPSRVSLAYERAIASFPVTTELWLQYARFQEVKMSSIPSLARKVYDRALRSCYWSGALWARAIRCAARSSHKDGLASSLEDQKDSLEDQKGLYLRAVRAGLQDYEGYVEVMLAWIDGLRQALVSSLNQPPGSSGDASTTIISSLREAFQQTTTMLSSYFPGAVDRSMRFISYWAHCESRLIKDLAAARKVWEDALKTDLGKYYEVWLSYADMERSLGHIKEARGVYKRGFGRRLEEGGQMVLCTAWLRFEREEGGADDYLHASIKVEPVMEEASAAAAAAMNESAAAAARQAAKEAPQLTKEEMARMRREKDPNFKKRDEAEKPKERPPAQKERPPAQKQPLVSKPAPDQNEGERNNESASWEKREF